jgi:hypothetical protein
MLLDLDRLAEDGLGVLVGLLCALVGGLRLQVLTDDDDREQDQLEEVGGDPGDQNGQAVASDRGGQADERDGREDVGANHRSDQSRDHQADPSVESDPLVVDLGRRRCLARKPLDRVRIGSRLVDRHVQVSFCRRWMRGDSSWQEECRQFDRWNETERLEPLHNT